MIDKLYVCPSFNCNLSCPHCNIQHKDNGPTQRFWDVLFGLKDIKNVVYFGGEPTYNSNIFYKVLSSNLITSISTNLVYIKPDVLSTLKNYSIATSWNPSRFTPNQYRLWLSNIQQLSGVWVLITLTEDLIQHNPDYYSWLWNDLQEANVDSILFEHLIDINMKEDLHERVDLWLCDFHKYYKYKPLNLIEKKLDNWYCDCKNVYTLLPSGELRQGCPQYTKMNVRTECLTCGLSHKCKPCILQQHCSYPKHLAKLINMEKQKCQ